MSGGLGGRLAILAVILLAAIWMLPLAWVFAASFKPNDVLMVRTDGLLSPPFTLRNYENLIGTSSLLRWLTNSAIVSLGQTALVLVLSSLAGYGFARTSFPGKRWVFGFVLSASPCRSRRSSSRSTACSPDSDCTIPTPRSSSRDWRPRSAST